MGRGRGGYTQKQIWYLDSGGNKVTDRGAIFVAELYREFPINREITSRF